MSAAKQTIHEVDFCSQIASAVNSLIGQNPGVYPFREARVEGFGTGSGRRKRKDLRFYGQGDKLVLCGEVKLPGTPEGRSPYDATLSADAEAKASNAGIKHFFTWNVNTFVLWDRSLWDRPLLDRRIWERRLGRTLAGPEDVAREDNLAFIKTHFLPDLLRDLADIISGRRRQWLPPDDIFIRSLESHLDWPVQLTAAYLLEHCNESKSFDLRVQRWMTDQDWTFVRTPHEEWAKAVDNMAKTLAYVWANRLIFYKALRSRFPELPRLELRASVKKPQDALAALESFLPKGSRAKRRLRAAIDARGAATGRPSWSSTPRAPLTLGAGSLRGIESVDFREVSSDVVGRIFQKLIGPDERHRYGQHFTGDDPVDLINVFCIRAAGRRGSRSRLRIGEFSGSRRTIASDTWTRAAGTPILSASCSAATLPFIRPTLATLNLAAREINDEANYPRIARCNFFDFAPPQPFCHIPDGDGGNRPVPLPAIGRGCRQSALCPSGESGERRTRPDLERSRRTPGPACA